MTIDATALGIVGALVSALATAVGFLFRDILKSRDALAVRVVKLESELDEEREAGSALQKKALDDQKELTKYWGAIGAVMERQQLGKGGE